MQEIILEIVNQYGYIGVFLLITLENLFPPIPSEVILTFGGFMTTFSRLNYWGVVFTATLGSVFGAIILYSLGRLLNAERIERLFDSKLGRVLHLRKTDVRRAGRWFTQHGNIAVFLCRFVAIVRSLISIPAGIAKMKLSIFLPLTFLGTFVWNLVLVYLGRVAGETWETVAEYVDYYSLGIILVFLLILMFFGVKFVKKRFLNKENKDQKEPEDNKD